MSDGQEQGTGTVFTEPEPRPRSVAISLVLGIFAIAAFSSFVALGTWQLHRLAWKQALIQRVEQRVHAAPVPPPSSERWAQVTADSDEYRHVSVTGEFLYPLTTKVQASTELGSGYWVLTPLRQANDGIVLINRGFVASNHAKSIAGPSGMVTVTGLLRITEPNGGFLRANDPGADRWYSRDVHAIAKARGLNKVAPYFIDADANRQFTNQKSFESVSEVPVGGLTVISFLNNHLVYALTWYALALMVGGASWWVVREERKLRS